MTFDFLGLEFRTLSLEHRDTLQLFLVRHPQPLTGFTFHTLMCWNDVYRYAWAFADSETLLVSCQVDDMGHRHLLQPLGSLKGEVQESLTKEIRKLPYALRFFGVNRGFIAENMDFVANFNLKEDPAGANYLYSSQDLAELPGKKFQKKRNLVSQAQRAYSWTVEPLTPALVEDCFTVLERIQVEDVEAPSASLVLELTSVAFSLRHFSLLEQQGIVVRVEGLPVAFSVFEPLSPNTVVIHIEKALRSYKGLYQVVNQEAAKRIVALGYEFINREEDLGDPGLKQAKLSYNPVQIIDAFLLCSGGRNPNDPPCERAW